MNVLLYCPQHAAVLLRPAEFFLIPALNLTPSTPKGSPSYVRSQSWPCGYCEPAAETKCESQFNVQKILATFDIAAKHSNFEIVQLLVVNGAVGQPTPYEKNGKDFPFWDNTPMPVRQKILDIVRQVKHARIVAATNSSKPASAQAAARPLPPGWEARKTNDGKPYYVNHSDKFENMDTTDVTFIRRVG